MTVRPLSRQRGGIRSALLLCTLAAGCAELPDLTDLAAFPAPSEAVRTPIFKANIVAEAYLDEWLPVGNGRRCRVEEAEQVLTEPLSESERPKVLPDIHALRLEIACSDESGAAVALDHALPRDAHWFLRTANGTAKPPSLRTKLSSSDPEALVFELPAQAAPLPAPRSYDLENGHALFSSHDDTGFRLSLESAGEQRQIVLRKRALDAALDAWLSALAAQLTDSGTGNNTGKAPLPPKDLDQLRELYRSLRERFLPTRLSLESIESQGEQLDLTLRLDRARTPDAPSPVATLRFTLPQDAARYFEDARLREVSDGRKAVACQEANAKLRARIPAALAPDESCNLLGLVLPVRCEKLPDDFKRDALALRTRCVPELEHAVRTTSNSVQVPSDLQVTLRRGRKASTAFDHSPRFVLSVFGNGATVFHGRSFVNGVGRSDGRTSQRLLQRLMRELKELDFFARRGGEWSKTGCSTDNPRGDVLSVHGAGKARMVLDRDGCRGPFSAAELAALSALIEQVAGTSGWIEPESAPDTRPVSEWVVSAD